MPLLLLLLYGPLDLAVHISWALGMLIVVVAGLVLWRTGLLADAVRIAAALIAIGFAAEWAHGSWSDWQHKQARQRRAAYQEQHRDAAFAGLVGHYFLADTVLLAANHNSLADTLPPVPVRAHLILRPDSTYAYHSTIPNDLTLDTAGTWRVSDYAFNKELSLEQFSVAFTPANHPNHSLRIVRNSGRPTEYEGAYLYNNRYTPFKLTQQKSHE